MTQNDNEQKQKIVLFINYGTIKTIESLRKTLEQIKNLGKLVDARIYFNQDEIEVKKEFAMEASKLGIEIVITMLAKDVKMAIDLLDAVYEEDIDLVAVAHHQEAIIPALKYANSKKRLVLLVPGKYKKVFENVVDELKEI